jgi:hypothetical protein
LRVGANGQRIHPVSARQGLSTVLAVREEMGGVGAAPEPQARKTTAEGKIVKIQRPPKTQAAPSVAGYSTGQMIRKSLPALLIFASMAALIVAYRFLAH